MELHQLRYFIQVARLESVSKAAQALRISQPALSKTIAKLEDELGCKLFDRSGKRLCLNDRGRFFLKEAENAIASLNAAAAAVGTSSKRLGGSVRIGVFGFQAYAIACVESFMKTHQDVTAAFDARQRTATSRVTREFDIIFYPEGPSFSGIKGVPYAHSRMRLAMSKDHPLAILPSVDLIQFKDDPFIFMNTTAGIYEQMFRLCTESGFSPRVRAITTSGAAQMRLIEAGLGVGLIDTPGLINDAPPRSSRPSPPTSARQASRESGAEGRIDPSVQTLPARNVHLADVHGAILEQTLCFATRPITLLTPTAREFLSHALRFFGMPDDTRIVERFESN